MHFKHTIKILSLFVFSTFLATDYEIIEKEQGFIPMTSYKFWKNNSKKSGRQSSKSYHGA